MSLLMDALKKAEEAKRRAEAAHADHPHAEHGPPAPPGAEPNRLPEISDRLELVDEQLEAGHKSAGPRQDAAPESAAARPARPAPRTYAGASAERDDDSAVQRQREAARTLFTAKQPASRRNFNWLVGLGTVLGLLMVAAYLLFQLDQSSKGLVVADPTKPAAPATGPATPPAPAAGTPPAAPQQATPPAAPPPAAADPAAKAPPLPPADTRPVPAKPVPAAAPVAAESRPPAQPPARRKPLPEAADPPANVGTPIAAEAGDIRLTRHEERPAQPALNGWQALQAGDLTLARRHYGEALRLDPRNVDALLGMAAIEQREGHPAQAEVLYRRVLEADPGNALAQSSLINLRGQGEGGNTESRLKTMVAADPDSHYLHFSLGNLYARQDRWNDAQQAYFRAYTLDPENPDYLYNLAVSLDHLRQSRLALQYYQNALAATQKRPAQFNRARLEGRLQELQAGR